MKIHVEIDATPQEVRTFFGLPDLGPLHEKIIGMLQDPMAYGAEGYDPLKLMSLFMAGAQGPWARWQEAFWKAFEAGREDKAGDENKGAAGD